MANSGVAPCGLVALIIMLSLPTGSSAHKVNLCADVTERALGGDNPVLTRPNRRGFVGVISLEGSLSWEEAISHSAIVLG
jgi:hypothetical protein